MALGGEISLPGDKSISHRTLICSAIVQGKSRIRNILDSEDIEMTRKMMESLGVRIEDGGEELIVYGRGKEGLREPDDVLYAGNSGTTIRIGSGILASIDGLSVVTGDRYLRRRPMDRVAEPLSLMGALVKGRENDRYPPLVIRGGDLKPIKYELPKASAQVKSAILLAAALSDVSAEVREPLPTRDHTERMLATMGGRVTSSGGRITFEPGEKLQPLDISVPSDFSSASFFIVGALITPGSEIRVKNVLINPLRVGLLDVLGRMGANIRIENRCILSGEETADICVRHSDLRGTVVTRSEIPLLIDEVPLIGVAAAFASGTTEVRGAEELRVKESDRIASITTQLFRLGVPIFELPDGFIVDGERGVSPRGGAVSSFGDHRIAMALEIYSLATGVNIDLDDSTCIATSFPGFYEKLRGLKS